MRWLLSVGVGLGCIASGALAERDFFKWDVAPALVAESALAGECDAVVLVVEPDCEPCAETLSAFNDLFGHASFHGFRERALIDRAEEPAIAERLGVLVAPTVVLLRDGEVVGRALGDLDRRALNDWAEAVLNREEIAAERAKQQENAGGRFEFIDDMLGPDSAFARFQSHLSRHEAAQASDVLLVPMEQRDPGAGWSDVELPVLQTIQVRWLARWYPPCRARMSGVMERAADALLDPDAIIDIDLPITVIASFTYALGERKQASRVLDHDDLDVVELLEDKLIGFGDVDAVGSQYGGWNAFLDARMKQNINKAITRPPGDISGKRALLYEIVGVAGQLFGHLLLEERDDEAMVVADWVLGRFEAPRARLDLLREAFMNDGEQRHRPWMDEWVAILEQTLPEEDYILQSVRMWVKNSELN